MSFSAGVQSDSDSPSAVNNKLSGQSSVKPNRPSLAKILLSLDGNSAKQQALSHVLSALQIMYARCVLQEVWTVGGRFFALTRSSS